jgi:hypothetical protein
VQQSLIAQGATTRSHSTKHMVCMQSLIAQQRHNDGHMMRTERLKANKELQQRIDLLDHDMARAQSTVDSLNLYSGDPVVLEAGDDIEVTIDLTSAFVTFKRNGALVGSVEIAPMALLRREHALMRKTAQELQKVQADISKLDAQVFGQGAFRHTEQLQTLKLYACHLQEEMAARRETVGRLADDLEAPDAAVRLWPAVLLSTPGDSVMLKVQSDTSDILQLGGRGQESEDKGVADGHGAKETAPPLRSFFLSQE